MLRTLVILIVIAVSAPPLLARETQQQNNARATKQMNETIFQMDQVQKSWPQNQNQKNKKKNKNKKKKKKKSQNCPEGYTKYSSKKNGKTVYECRKD